MEKLNIKDIINNAKDELERARELLSENEAAINSFLISDIDSSLERLQDINERIHFALLLSLYVGYINAKSDYLYDCDNLTWREEYIKWASEIDFEYDGNFIDSEWMYNTASEIAIDICEASHD